MARDVATVGVAAGALWLAAISASLPATGRAAELTALRTEYDQREKELLQWFSAPKADAALGQSLPLAFSRLADRFSQAAQAAPRGSEDFQQALFWGGWSHYYAAVLNEATSRAGNLENARRSFHEFLDIVDVDTDQWSADLLGLDNEGMCLGLLGLALVELAAGKDREADFCFSMLEDPLVPQKLHAENQLWKIRGLLYAGRKELATKQLLQLAGQGTQKLSDGETGLCVLAAVQAFRPQGLLDRRTGFQMLTALLESGQAPLVDKILGALELELTDGPLELQLRSARLAFYRAHRSSSREGLMRAHELLKPLVNRLWAAGINDVLLEGRYQIAYCEHSLDRLQLAATEAGKCVQAVAEERQAGRAWKPYAEIVERATLLELACLSKLADVGGEDERKRIAAKLTAVQNDPEFHGAKNAELAAYQLTRLQQNTAAPEDLVAWLRKIGPESARYPDALFDIAKVRYRSWKSAPAESRGTALPPLREACADYWKKTRPAPNSVRDLQAMVWLAEACLETGQPAEAGKFLSSIATLAAKPDGKISQQLIVDYHYLRARLSETEKNAAELAREARWLADHAQDSDFELYALTQLCKLSEGTPLDQIPQPQVDALLKDCQRLLKRLQLASDTRRQPLFAAGDSNAEYAARRHAELAAFLKRPALAAESLVLLADGFPKRVAYRRQAALAFYQAADYPKSCEQWRELLKRLDESRDGADWYEAKFHLIDCLRREDPAAAREVLEQLFAVYDPRQFPVWESKLNGLRKTLSEGN